MEDLRLYGLGSSASPVVGNGASFVGCCGSPPPPEVGAGWDSSADTLCSAWLREVLVAGEGCVPEETAGAGLVSVGAAVGS